MPLINKEHNDNVLLLDGEHSGDVLLIDKAPNGNVLLIDREQPHIGRWCWICISSKAHRISKTSEAHRIGEKTFQSN